MSTKAVSIADLAGQGTGIFGSVTSDAPSPASEPATPVAPSDQITWAKLDDGWYVRLPVSVSYSSGDTVIVTKKDGSTVQATLVDPYRTIGHWQHWTAKQTGKTQAKGERKPNRYAGDCHKCGSRVSEGSGHLGPKINGQWTVEHRDGECFAQPVEETKTSDLQAADAYTEPIWPGVYTVETATGHRTFRVVVQRHDADFAPGATVIEYLSGRDNDNDYTGFAFLKGGRLQVWKRFRERSSDLVDVAGVFVANADAAQRAADSGEPVTIEGIDGTWTLYAAKHCIRCGRTLSNPESNRTGIGPECSKRGGW